MLRACLIVGVIVGAMCAITCRKPGSEADVSGTIHAIDCDVHPAVLNVKALLPYRELGVTDFVLGIRPPLDWDSITLFAERVIPLLRPASAPA